MLPEFMQIVDVFREVQLPLLAVLLVLGAAGKTTRRATADGVAVLVPERLRRPTTVGTGMVEAVAAVGLIGLTGIWGEAARVLTAVMFAVAVVVLFLVRRRDPEAGCGCFGGLGRAPVGWRTFARAGLLSAVASTTIGVEPTGWQVVSAFTWVHAAVLGVELLVLAALSPELRGVLTRALHREPCALRRYPLRRAERRLRGSDVWRSLGPVMLKEEPEDVWRHGCRYFLRYDGLRYGQRVDVVYAVRLEGRPSTAVRASVVDRESEEVVATFGAVTGVELQGPPRKLPSPREAARRDAVRQDRRKTRRSLQKAQENPSGLPREDLDTGRPV